MTEKIIIFDTTLRDGEQSPGFSMNIDEKMQLATQLARLNVDVIEAGFPIASDGDFEAVRCVSKEITTCSIAGLCRIRKQDIDRAAEALRDAKHPRIHVFVGTSDIHLKHQLRKTQEEVLKEAVEAVRYAKQFTDDVEFSAMDGSRTSEDYLVRIFEEVIAAGATTINLADTVGYAIPQEFARLVENLRRRVGNMDRAVLSVHCHNDLGLAVANSLVSIQRGARQVECTVNGIGERAGNTSLEELVMILRTRSDFLPYRTDVRTEEIYRSSRLLSSITGMLVQANKAIVGKNAFAHESGIHQDGVLKERTTFEIMTPQSIGLSTSSLVLGKHSGRHAFSVRLKELGYNLAQEEINATFKRFKDLADKKKEIFDEDLEAIVQDELATVPQEYQLEFLQITCGTHSLPTATVGLRRQEEVIRDAAVGDGPVDAACKAVERITGVHGKLLEYTIRAVSGGKDAIGEVHVRVAVGDRVFVGRGASTDVVEGSVKAYLNAVNKAVQVGHPRG